MSARQPPYKDTNRACLFVAVFGLSLNLAAAVSWMIILKFSFFLWSDAKSQADLGQFLAENRFQIAMTTLAFAMTPTLFAVFSTAYKFRTANLTPVIILHASLSLLLVFLFARSTPLIVEIASSWALAVFGGSFWIHNKLAEMAPPHHQPGPATPITSAANLGHEGSFDNPAEDRSITFLEKPVKSAIKLLMMLFLFLVITPLIAAAYFANTESYVTSFVIAAFALGTAHVTYKIWRNIPRHFGTLKIDEAGLNFGGGTLPWADVGRIWTSTGNTINVETDMLSERSYLDSDVYGPGRLSEMFVRIKRIWVGINFVTINARNIETPAGEIIAAIERARPRKAST
jgi:hypothetical protein